MLSLSVVSEPRACHACVYLYVAVCQWPFMCCLYVSVNFVSKNGCVCAVGVFVCACACVYICVSVCIHVFVLLLCVISQICWAGVHCSLPYKGVVVRVGFGGRGSGW